MHQETWKRINLGKMQVQFKISKRYIREINSLSDPYSKCRKYELNQFEPTTLIINRSKYHISHYKINQ